MAHDGIPPDQVAVSTYKFTIKNQANPWNLMTVGNLTHPKLWTTSWWFQPI